jgi:hypothetical protein
MLKFITKAKNLFFMLFFSLLTLSVLNSCSKTSKLDGTTWKGSYSYQRDDINNSYERNYSGKIDFIVSFSESAVNVIGNYTSYHEQDWDGDGEFEPVTNKGTENLSGTYTYSKKSITVNIYGEQWIGTMDDKNTMKLNLSGDINEPVKLTKQ